MEAEELGVSPQRREAGHRDGDTRRALPVHEALHGRLEDRPFLGVGGIDPLRLGDPERVVLPVRLVRVESPPHRGSLHEGLEQGRRPVGCEEDPGVVDALEVVGEELEHDGVGPEPASDGEDPDHVVDEAAPAHAEVQDLDVRRPVPRGREASLELLGVRVLEGDPGAPRVAVADGEDAPAIGGTGDRELGAPEPMGVEPPVRPRRSTEGNALDEEADRPVAHVELPSARNRRPGKGRRRGLLREPGPGSGTGLAGEMRLGLGGCGSRKSERDLQGDQGPQGHPDPHGDEDPARRTSTGVRHRSGGRVGSPTRSAPGRAAYRRCRSR